jgi:negative regulator of sigma-B (phosphoserine phosphatase)
METAMREIIEWSFAASAQTGQTESGDCVFVSTLENEALIALMDGLGHGAEAAYAAKLAVNVLAGYTGRQSLIAMVRECHEKLRGSRGVVMSLALFNSLDGTMTWLGIGTVEGVLLHKDAHRIPRQESLLLRAGIVGDRLPPLSASTIQPGEGDLLMFATDGIRHGFADDIVLSDSPRRLASRILAQHDRGTDDATILVARYLNDENTASRR